MSGVLRIHPIPPQLGLSWPLPDELSDADLEQLLSPCHFGDAQIMGILKQVGLG